MYKPPHVGLAPATDRLGRHYPEVYSARAQCRNAGFFGCRTARVPEQFAMRPVSLESASHSSYLPAITTGANADVRERTSTSRHGDNSGAAHANSAANATWPESNTSHWNSTTATTATIVICQWTWTVAMVKPSSQDPPDGVNSPR
jgi:Tfp pilus assembly protein PilW